MKILIIGNGAREYALGLALSSDSRVAQLYFAPGNGATETLGTNLIASSYDELLNIAQDIAISLVIVGPEAPLLAGVSDLFAKAGFLVFGP
ncbi:MAG: phosphoribosylamine--glycine ligase, partial [Helicobacter sp.]|nr:phosphoribosylamine--glycine ligase [Helicobacter sp.]